MKLTKRKRKNSVWTLLSHNLRCNPGISTPFCGLGRGSQLLSAQHSECILLITRPQRFSRSALRSNGPRDYTFTFSLMCPCIIGHIKFDHTWVGRGYTVVQGYLSKSELPYSCNFYGEF